MARGTMHAPKPDDQRRRNNAPTHGAQLVTDDGKRRGPDLVGAYSDETHAWFDVWRTSAQAQLFWPTDWSRLVLLAAIVDAYHLKPTAAALSEIRLNEERLGATVVDRMRARIARDPSESLDAPSAPVTPLHAVGKPDARSRLLAAEQAPRESAPDPESEPPWTTTT